MQTYYKKLLLLLILLTVLFFLSLALGSAEEPCELCQLCRNKALVKEAIWAFDEDPYDANLPIQFDPNYIQIGPYSMFGTTPSPHVSGSGTGIHFVHWPVTFESIIAEGDMVSIRLSWDNDYGGPSVKTMPGPYFHELASYRIANGKIVRGWVASIYSP